MLHDLQTYFLHGIYEDDRAILPQLSEKRLSAKQQINIYRNSIFAGLLKALREIYPVTERLVGTEFFHALLMRYIAYTPSHHPDINLYGKSLADFTRDFPPAQSLPYLPDVMQLEWAWHWALQTADDTQLRSIQNLLSLPHAQLDQVVLLLHPSATLLSSPYPVLTIWQVNQTDFIGEQTVNLYNGSQDLFIWRNSDELRIDLLTPSQTRWLAAVVTGQTLGQMQALADFAGNTTDLLQRGYITDYRIEHNDMLF